MMRIIMKKIKIKKMAKNNNKKKKIKIITKNIK